MDAPTMMIPRLPFARYVETIADQAAALADLLSGPDVDLRVPVTSCPGWNLAQLTQHVGEELRWLELLVRTRATSMPDTSAMRDVDPEPSRDPGATGAWIAEGADELAATLAEAGPDATVWTPLSSFGTTTSFFARRFAHEQLIHRIDAVLGVRPDTTTAGLEIPADLADDAFAEWFEQGAVPEMLTLHPHRRELLGHGHRLLLTASDVPGCSWLVDLTGDTLVHRPAGPADRADVEFRGPLTELLLVVYARRPLDAVEVAGDRELAARWLAHVGFA